MPVSVVSVDYDFGSMVENEYAFTNNKNTSLKFISNLKLRLQKGEL